jgi:hypothetical protein
MGGLVEIWHRQDGGSYNRPMRLVGRILVVLAVCGGPAFVTSIGCGVTSSS